MMAKVKGKVILNPIALQNIRQQLRDAAWLTMENVRDDLISSQTMPFDTGTMQNSETFVVIAFGDNDIRAILVHGGPYARYQYYGISVKGNPLNYQTVNNPYARSHWLKPYIDGVFLTEAFNKNLKRIREET